MNEKIAFIGGGNMATALLGGLLHQGWSPSAIDVVEPMAEQRASLAARFGVRTFEAAGEFLREARVVVWAVKPQVMGEAAAAAAPFTRNALHVSIAAGIRITDLAGWLGTRRVVRAMPNLPAVVRAGVTGVCADSELGEAERELAARILGSAGHVFWVQSEDWMNAVTAVSGSGPGYVFHFLEGFQQAAQEMGFPPEQARELVLLVTLGAVQLARYDAAGLKELRGRVSSKGGTTLAGTNRLDEAGTQQAMVAAVRAARDRALELGARG